jgi:hypothetical protein
MGAAFAGALACAVLAIILRGSGPNGIGVGLRLTARFSYAFFWLAYVGGALASVFGPSFLIIGRRAREFGLAFASAQLVHVGLVARLAWISQPEPLTDAIMPFFAIAIVWTYLLAALSTSYSRRIFGPNMLNIVLIIGSEYIALTFFVDFIISPKYPIQYLALYIPFWIMLLLGPLLRVAALAKKISGRAATASS